LGDKTFFKSIKVLPPAVVGTYSKGEFSLSTYWQIKYQPDRTRSRDDFVKALAETFSKAVRTGMKEDLRYGLSLSGGLDSRTILATMLKEGLLDRVRTFTHSVSGSNELKVAKEVASVAGARHQEILLDTQGLIHFAEDAVYRTDGMANILHCYILDCFDKISRDIDVSFHGLAGDLLLGGSYLENRILNSTDDEQFFDSIQRKMTVFTPEMLSELLTPDFLGSNEIDYDESLRLALSDVHEAEAGNRADSFFLQNHVRRLTRLGGVLYRSKCEEATPTYDNDFFDLVLTIPPELRKDHVIFLDLLKALSPKLARAKYAKYMAPADSSPFGWRIGARILSLKRRLRNLILRISSGRVSLTDRHHFVNFGEWFRSDPQWRDLLRVLLLDQSSRTRKYFKRDFVEKLIHNHLTGTSDNTIRLANLVTFELFLREFGNSTYPSSPTFPI
jgi:asparagine synthase (glutamine-hydrolysing)